MPHKVLDRRTSVSPKSDRSYMPSVCLARDCSNFLDRKSSIECFRETVFQGSDEQVNLKAKCGYFEAAVTLAYWHGLPTVQRVDAPRPTTVEHGNQSKMPHEICALFHKARSVGGGTDDDSIQQSPSRGRASFLFKGFAVKTCNLNRATAMADWTEDSFMSQWNQKYVSTNLKPGAQQYSKEFFLALNSDLVASQPELKGASYAIIAAACCATGRADVVGQFFDHLTTNSTEAESEAMFLRLREAVTIIFPYLGLPCCMPACYGMIGVIQRKGKQFASLKRLRKDTVDSEDASKGADLRARIYKGVGNSEIFDLMKIYFSDLYTCSTIVTWGYLISKTNEEVFQPQESHLIIATAIMALGATRQTKSHIKASLGIGNSVDCIKAVIHAVSEITKWSNCPIAKFDVDELSRELQASLRA